MFYSKKKGGFYDPAIHGNNIPTDAVKISHEEHQDLLEGQSSGKIIEGNELGEPVLVEPKKPTQEQIIAGIVASIQSHMDKKARQYGYGDLQSAVTYADEPAVPDFQREGKAFREWRSLVWQKAIQMLDDFKSGNAGEVDSKQAIGMLPIFSLDSEENKD